MPRTERFGSPILLSTLFGGASPVRVTCVRETPFMNRSVRVAAVQSPSLGNAAQATDRAVELIAEAGSKGADLVAFSETWLPGYPFFAFGGYLETLGDRAAYLEQSIVVPGPESERLCAAARQAQADVVIGVAERDGDSGGSVYATLLFIGADGELLGRHRKLKPTGPERTIWSDGDARGLRVHQRPYGRLSGLNCWEHNMMLPGYVLASEGTEIHVAAWPGGPPEMTRSTLLSQAFASQASCYVIAVGACQPEIPELGPGASMIVDPNGQILEGPIEGEQILIADLHPKAVHRAKTSADNGGHYSRRDIFNVTVDRSPRRSFSEHDGNSAVVGEQADWAEVSPAHAIASELAVED